jgi:O-antigen/teichoic acid export membrane protein
MAETGKSFLRKFVGFSIVTWVSFILSFFTAPIATRLFAPDMLGKINIFNTYTNLFGVLVLVGLDQAFARFYHERPNNHTKGYLFSFCFGITYALLICVIILSLPFSSFISYILFQETDNLLLYLFFISVFCYATLRYLNLSYRMEQNIKMYTIQGILMTIVSRVLYLGVGFYDPTYKSALIVLTFTHIVLAVVFLIIQRHQFEFIIEYDKLFGKEVFKYAFPLIPVSVLMWANTSIPQIVIQNTMDDYSVGIFTSALHLANIVLIIQAGFNTFWTPYAYENYKTQKEQFYKVHRYLICVITFLALILILSQDVVFLLLGEKYRVAKVFFPFLTLSPICYIIAETTGIGIDISKKTYYNLVVFTNSVVFNLIFCIIFGDLIGISGIAIATALASIIAMAIKTYIGQKYYSSVNSYKYIYRCVCLILMSSLITLLEPSFAIKYVSLFVLIIVSCFLFRKDIMDLKNYTVGFIKK